MGEAPDSTVVDPEGHRVAFENEHIRVLEIRLRQGAEVAMHSHPPRLIVAINSYRIMSTDQSGNVSIVDRRPGEAVWSDAEEHAAQVLAGPIHTIEIEPKNLP
ncbi:MAG: hypothetical protein ACE5MI_01850 [Acidimicrobiia bacterium]